MTENAQTTITTPANAGQGNSGAPTPGAVQTAGDQAQPFATFATEAELMARVHRDGRRQMNEAARNLGFGSWSEMNEALAALRPAASTPAAAAPGTPQAQPATPVQPAPGPAAPLATPAQAAPVDLSLAIQAAAKVGLPVALITRLRGATLDELEADARSLLSLAPTAQGATPGIPPATTPTSPVTFTRTQLKNAKFVRENRDAILAAGAEGRIVNS